MAQQIERLIQRMINLGLIEVEADKVSLSLLGRACGRSSLSFDAAMRLIEIVRSVPDRLLGGINLMALMQGLPAEEMGYTPMLQGAREAVRVDQAMHRFDREIVMSLQRYAGENLEFFARCNWREDGQLLARPLSLWSARPVISGDHRGRIDDLLRAAL